MNARHEFWCHLGDSWEHIKGWTAVLAVLVAIVVVVSAALGAL